MLSASVVVGGQPVMAESLAARLRFEPDLDVVAVVTSTAEALTVVAMREADVVLIDMEMGDDGIVLGRRLREVSPATRLIYIAPLSDGGRVGEAVRYGAQGWVAKDTSVSHLLEVLRGVLRNETWIPPLLLTQVLRQFEPLEPCEPDRLCDLTTREREVLECLVEGLPRTKIAERLFLSTNTVRTYIQNVLTKLDVHSTLEAVAIAHAARCNRRCRTRRQLRARCGSQLTAAGKQDQPAG